MLLDFICVERKAKNLHSNVNENTYFMMTYFIALHTIDTKALQCHFSDVFY